MKKKLIVMIFQRFSFILGIAILLLFFVPMMFGIMPYIVLSGSMEPEIKTGSVVYIDSKVKPEQIKVGDIIGYNAKDGQVTHRVIKINDDGSFVTKGDSNKDEDTQPVPSDKIKGRDVFSIPYIGYMAGFVKSKQGLVFVSIYIVLNFLCIIFDKKIYNNELSSSFKKAIMNCQTLDEVKKLIIEEMDSFRDQVIEDVSTIELQKIAKSDDEKKVKTKNEKPKNTKFEFNVNIPNIKNKLNLNKKISSKSGKGKHAKLGKDELFYSGENMLNEISKDYSLNSLYSGFKAEEAIKNINLMKISGREEQGVVDNTYNEMATLLNTIENIDEDCLEKVKEQIVKYDNPHLRELRDVLKKNRDVFVEYAKQEKQDIIKK